VNAKQPRKKHGPEHYVQEAIITFLRYKGWFVLNTHGNMYQSGFPDLFATHSRYGNRWIEVKLPGMKGSKFTPAQLDTFPKLVANGSGVWILTAGDEEQYELLFKKCNWWMFTPSFKDALK
jgi:hypothetical protein